MTCKICGNLDGNTKHLAREMMFGFRDCFTYLECANCGCLQLQDPPSNLERYYPKDYYAFRKDRIHTGSMMQKYVRRKRAEHCLQKKNIVGWITAKAYGLPSYYDWFQRTNIGLNSRILDIGCGNGDLLAKLQREGFSSLLGVDPYIEKDIDLGGGCAIRKTTLKEIDGQFDLVMMHHSFEHMDRPQEIMRTVTRLFGRRKFLLIRIPVASSYAWRTYGHNWVQLDPPRHMFLHTVKSMELMASKAGMRLAEVVYDSTALQFYGSEQYRQDLPLHSDKSHWMNPHDSIFSASAIADFKERAIALNFAKDGDQACFYLTRE